VKYAVNSWYLGVDKEGSMTKKIIEIIGA